MTFWDKLQAELGALLGEGKTVAQMEAEEAENNRRLRELNALETYGPEWQQQAELNITEHDTDVAAEIESEFETGWLEGRENIEDFGRGVGSVLGDVAGAAAGGVAAGAWVVFKKNWWWMIPALIALFFFYGGARFLPKRKAAR